MFCWRRAIVRLVAFVWLFSAASFQMFPQITCLRIYKITLVAFVDTVCFQMCIRLVYFLERCCGGMVYFLERCCLGMVLFLERCRVVESFSRNVRGCVILLKLSVWFGLLERRLAFLERCKNLDLVIPHNDKQTSWKGPGKKLELMDSHCLLRGQISPLSLAIFSALSSSLLTAMLRLRFGLRLSSFFSMLEK